MNWTPNGPIPGENMTSDVKNYPWHRPPQFANLDDAIDAVASKLCSEEGCNVLLTNIELGAPISSLVETLVLAGVMKGRWTIDMGILLAGPISHIMVLLAKAYGIKYNLGIDKKVRVGVAFAKGFQPKAINPEKAAKAADSVDIEAVKEKAGGLMAAKPGSIR